MKTVHQKTWWRWPDENNIPLELWIHYIHLPEFSVYILVLKVKQCFLDFFNIPDFLCIFLLQNHTYTIKPEKTVWILNIFAKKIRSSSKTFFFFFISKYLYPLFCSSSLEWNLPVLFLIVPSLDFLVYLSAEKAVLFPKCFEISDCSAKFSPKEKNLLVI